MDWTRPTTQLLGRFQPWHRGHLELFKRGISKTGQVVILLRKEDGTDSNPYNFGERVKFISEDLKKHGFTRTLDYDIVEVPNITHITYGRDVGYKIEQEHFDKEIEDVSATEIRNGLYKENSS
jgi:nicotinamide mononucleotide adenylyltransferase